MASDNTTTSDDAPGTSSGPAAKTAAKTSSSASKAAAAQPVDRQFRTVYPVDNFAVTVPGGDSGDDRVYHLARTEWTTIPAADVDDVLDLANDSRIAVKTRKVPDSE